MNLKSIFDKEFKEQKEVLFCENKKLRYWVCKDLSSTWIRVETLDGEQVELIHGDKNITNKLVELNNESTCNGGNKERTYLAIRKINNLE